MKTIILHLEYLLFRHDCVIIPGFGAFLASNRKAHIDFIKGEILPPSREIMFNQAILTDDGLLANSIARVNALSFEEARQVIFRECSELKNELFSQGRLKIGNIGMLNVGEENTIYFTPDEGPDSIGYTPGLQAINFPIIGAEETPAIQSLSPAPAKRAFHKLSKIAAAVVFSAAVVVAYFLFPLPSDKREQRASVVPVEVIMKKDKTASIPDSTLSPIPAEVSSPLPVSDDSISEEPMHYLIVATFKDKEDAEKFVSIYSTPDHPLTTISSRKVTRVSFASSDNKDDLRKLFNSKELTERFSNPWIWSKD